MNNKKWPIWLKAGLIGAVIYLIIAIVGWFSHITFPLFLISFNSFLFSSVSFLSPVCEPWCPYLVFLVALIVGFLTGALIGLFYKARSKKSIT